MKPKHILFGLLSPSLGGHTRTAVALAETLRGRGHTIDFLVDAAFETTGLVSGAGFPLVRVAAFRDGVLLPSFRKALRTVVVEGRYDAIHWFEMHAGAREAASVAARSGRAFVWTLTSGGPPADYFGLNRVVAFTQEVAEDVRRRSPRTVVHLVPARIDFRELDDEFTRAARSEIRSRFSVGDSDLLIVRVARCAQLYLRSVGLGIALAERLTRTGRSAVFLHAGYVYEPRAAVEIRSMVDAANARAGRTVAYSVTDDVAHGTRYAAAADVCIASGRTALEALALGRPTLIVWGSRFLGLIGPDNIREMADTNFQGRNTAPFLLDDEIVNRMHRAVNARLEHPEQSARTQELCSQFVREQYSLDAAAGTYEALYDERVVTVDGFLKHYSSPRRLARGLRQRLPHSVRSSRPMKLLRRVRSWAAPMSEE